MVPYCGHGSSDLKRATEIALEAIGELGLDEGFAALAFPTQAKPMPQWP